MAISISMIEKKEEELELVPCIQYFVTLKDQTKVQKQNQYNKPSFCLRVRPQSRKNQYWSLDNGRPYSGDLQNKSLHLFHIRQRWEEEVF